MDIVLFTPVKIIFVKMNRNGRLKNGNGSKTVEIKMTVVEGDLERPQPQTTLKLLKEIENLRMSDLVMEEDEVRCAAPAFGPDEKLYNDLIGLDVHVDCPMKKRIIARPAVKRDNIPNPSEFLGLCVMPEYGFHHVICEELAEVEHPFVSHSITKKRNLWKNL